MMDPTPMAVEEIRKRVMREAEEAFAKEVKASRSDRRNPIVPVSIQWSWRGRPWLAKPWELVSLWEELVECHLPLQGLIRDSKEGIKRASSAGTISD